MNEMVGPEGGLSYITMFSLVDITTTGTIGRFRIQTNMLGSVLDTEPLWKKSRNQQRNWETAIQIIGLRAQPLYLENSVVLLNHDLSKLDFGSSYKNTNQTVWCFMFGVEHSHVYDIDNQELKSLIDDFNGVPVTLSLDETAEFKNPTFITKGDFTNTYFKTINNN